MKKTLKSMAVIIAVAVATTGLHMNVNKVEVKAASKVTYTLKNGVLTIKGKGKMPKSMTFKNNKKIKKVVIEKGVTSISQDAFKGCKKLKEVKIANTVKHISKRAFAKTGIKNITIPKSVDTMGVKVFESCDNLKSITMPGDVNVRQAESFDRTLNPDTEVDTVKFTTELNLDNITYLYANNFDIHKKDKNYKDIDGVIYTKDGKELVRVPSEREEITVDENCEVFCTNAIYYSLRGFDGEPVGICTEINKVVLPANVKEIDNEKHYRISSGSPYVFIDEWVVENKNIRGLDELFVTVYDGENYASLKEFSSEHFPELITVKDGMYLLGDNVLIGFVNNENNEKNVVIPDGIKEIHGKVFNDFKNPIESVTLPEGLEVIGDYVFNETNITEIKLPSTVKEIGYSFADCAKLTKVELNEGLEKIGTSFYGCSSLREVVIPNTVKTIEENAFRFTAIEKIVIPDSVEEIGENAFRVSTLSDIVIGKNVKYIGKYAFANTGWEKLVVPASVKKIDEGAFSNCSYATEIIIENKQAEISGNAFENSTKLNVVCEYAPKKYVTSLYNTNYESKNKYIYGTYAWNTNNNVKKYQVMVADDAKFTKSVVKKTVKTNQYTIKGKATEYKYIKVRPIINKNGKRVYGAWSNVCKF